MAQFRKGCGGPRYAAARKLIERMEQLGCSCEKHVAGTGTIYVTVWAPWVDELEDQYPGSRVVRIGNHHTAYESEDYNLDPNREVGLRHGEVVARLREEFRGFLDDKGRGKNPARCV